MDFRMQRNIDRQYFDYKRTMQNQISDKLKDLKIERLELEKNSEININKLVEIKKMVDKLCNKFNSLWRWRYEIGWYMCCTPNHKL